MKRAAAVIMGPVLVVLVGLAPGGALGQCYGDCDHDGTVTVGEILIGVNIALGNALTDDCTAGDVNSDGQISVDEILAAVNNALNGCEQQAPELVGTWDEVSITVDGMSTDCPGEIEVTDEISVACFTDAFTFNADNTFVRTTTTDEYGDPYDWRDEGTWSVNGTLLTITTTREGEDADHLEPVDPPTQEVATWSVSGDTLTMVIHWGDLDVTGTFQRR
jgi:hypothetical protein